MNPLTSLLRSRANQALLAALTLIVSGWLLLGTGVGVWLWAVALFALAVSCLLARDWTSAGVRLSIVAMAFLAFPLAVNGAVHTLDAAGIVDVENGGTEPARLR
jgi:hypothetical protein